MQNEERFRSALGGYNKDDVNRYIKETDLANAARLDALQKQLDEVTDSFDHARKEIFDLTTDKNELTQKLTDSTTQAAEKENELAVQEATIRDLQKRLEVARAQNDAQNTVIDKLKKESAATSAQLMEYTAKIETLEKEKAAAATEIASLTAEKEKTIAACAETEKAAKMSVQSAIESEEIKWRNQLEAAVAEEKARGEAELDRLRHEYDSGEESIAYKLRMYDKISGQIGDILLNANRNADDILSSAREEADKLRSDAMEESNRIGEEAQAQAMRTRSETQEEAAYIRDRLSDTAGQLLSEISGDLHDNIGSCLREVDTCIAEMQSDMETILNAIQARYREMNDRILYYQNCVTDSIEEKLHDMDEKYGIPQHKENAQ